MIQRIQTLWLALVVLLSIAMFFFPLAMFSFPYKEIDIEAVYRLLPSSGQPYQITPSWLLLIFNVLVGVSALITIFMYKYRIRQIRILAFSFLFTVIEVMMLFFVSIDGGLKEAITTMYANDATMIEQTIKIAKTTYGLSSYLPIIQLILFVFARSGIVKDEKIVRESSRIR